MSNIKQPHITELGDGHHGSPAEQLDRILDAQLRNAVDAQSKGLRMYDSLRNISEVIGGEYGDRVIFELVQNAHDAHTSGTDGSILLKLVIQGPSKGDLYVANRGRGFGATNVDAIRNVAVSSKSVGEGIGNKGLGFRSVETLTNDPRIYSQAHSEPSDSFTGYCFRFARRNEIFESARLLTSEKIAQKVADVLPRYLGAVPTQNQPKTIRQFAKDGFATVIHLPLRNEDAVSLARNQVNGLANMDVPLLLFLDRLANISVQITEKGSVRKKTLTRQVLSRPSTNEKSLIEHEIVSIGPGRRRYLIARRPVDKAKLKQAVEDSIATEPQLARWREWQGEPKVAVAVALSQNTIESSRAYNFLPMAAEVSSSIRGHMDAPFYASIDRRRANFDLPLNAFLLDELAETALTSAIEMKPLAPELGRNAIFDLASWSPKDVLRMRRVSSVVGHNWLDHELVPCAGVSDRWCTFNNAYVWHEQGLKLLRVRRLIKAEVPNLADPKLESDRLQRLQETLAGVSQVSEPNENTMADWLEAVAISLDQDNSSQRTWQTFYEEVCKVLKNVTAIRHLAGKTILRTKSGELHAAGGTGKHPVYIRESGVKGRGKDRAPLPPTAVASKILILDDQIKLSTEITANFVKAGLLYRYDALQVLKRVHATFGHRPAPKRREATLKWAFNVWRAEGVKAEAILRQIDLHVETVAGWRPASDARFSEGWTMEGRKLSTYLSEASPHSRDCAEAAKLLLVSNPKWSSSSDIMRKSWRDFLRAAGVRDGLPLLLDDSVPDSGTPIYTWHAFLKESVRTKGRGTEWLSLSKNARIPNPYTNYIRRGELWRIPGQIEHANLPTEARHRLAELIMIQLANENQSWLRWKLGRYDRYPNEYNEQLFHTPASAFIAKAPWMAVEGDTERFETPSNLWASNDRKDKPPRFVDRPRDRLVEFIDEEAHIENVIFAAPINLRNWADVDDIIRKLNDLAGGSDELEPRERVSFRRVYQQIWAQTCQSEVRLPSDLTITVTTSVGLSSIQGDPLNPPRIFVTGDPLSAESKAVLAAGQSVLELSDDALMLPALEMLRISGGFDVKNVDIGEIGVLIDGEPMGATLSNPLFAADGLEWLVEAVVLANEVLGQGLERQISSNAIERRLRQVRVRSCGMIKLSVAGAAVEEILPFYALPDDDLPTLVIGDDRPISWAVLGDAAPSLSSLLDRRLRSFETLLLRLAAHGATNDPRERPSDEALAKALNCKVELVREHTLAIRTDGDLLVQRLLPVLACLFDLDTARVFEGRLDSSPLRSDVIDALSIFSHQLPVTPSALLDEVARADIAEIRRSLDLDFVRLNDMLAAFGQPILSNESELRRLFDTWKSELTASALDRLRRRFYADFTEGRALADYVRLKSLDFLTFQTEWVADREYLAKSDVSALLDEHLDELVGADIQRELESLSLIRNRSRRILHHFIDDAFQLMGAWCFRNNQRNPWQGGTQEVLKKIDQHGLFDFERIDKGGEIAVLVKGKCWAEGMPPTSDPVVLGLNPNDLHGEIERERERTLKIEQAKRTICFGDANLDTGATDFVQKLIDQADMQLEDKAWLTRSRKKFSLVEQSPMRSRSGGGSGKEGKGHRPARLNNEVKSAMGFASEYLASRFLEEKHKDRYDDLCWVSQNRGRFLTDWDGDDSLGFDFRVKTSDVEWRYEVKSNLDDSFEFEFTQNEMRSAAECASDGSRKYRILYVPFVFDPQRWRVMELPNPMGEKGRSLFQPIGTGATRFKFRTL